MGISIRLIGPLGFDLGEKYWTPQTCATEGGNMLLVSWEGRLP